MLTTTELVRILIKMKTRLAFGGKANWQSVVGLIGLLIGVVATVVVAWRVVQTRTAVDSSTQLMLMLTGISLAWVILSVIAGSGEAVLDPGKFAIYPVSVRQLITAFFAAAFVGVLAPGTAVVALSAVTHAPSFGAAVLIVIAALVVLAVSVLSGRLGIAMMSSLVRGRGTRELAGIVVALVAGFAGLAPQFVFQVADEFREPERELARSILRWVPWGWGPEAIASAAEGRLGRALFLTVLAGALAAVIAGSWVRLMEQILTTRPAASEATSIEGGLVPKMLQPLGRSPMVAVTARTLRQLRRDPREFLEVAAFLPVVFISAVPALDAIRERDPQVVLASAGIGVALGITSLNMFGADARSFGVDVFASGDVTPVVFGKAAARVILGMPFVLIAGVGLAAITGGWQFLLPGIFISLTALLTMTAVGMQSSVRFAFPLPEKATVGGGSSGASGCVTGIIRMMGLLIAFAVAAIGTAPVVFVSVRVSPLAGAAVGVVALAYGLVVFWFLGRWAGKRATATAPELFQTLSTPVG